MYLSFALGAIDRQSEAYYHAARRLSLINNRVDIELQMLLFSGRLEEARTLFEMGSRLGMDLQPELAAELALAERDANALESVVLAQGDDSWTTAYGYTWYSALVPYLRGDFERASEIISTMKDDDGDEFILNRFFVALVERDIDAAVDHYANAVYAAEPTAILWHFNVYSDLFPELDASPRYQTLLKDLKLDSASRAKIRIPDLPF